MAISPSAFPRLSNGTFIVPFSWNFALWWAFYHLATWTVSLQLNSTLTTAYAQSTKIACRILVAHVAYSQFTKHWLYTYFRTYHINKYIDRAAVDSTSVGRAWKIMRFDVVWGREPLKYIQLKRTYIFDKNFFNLLWECVTGCIIHTFTRNENHPSRSRNTVERVIFEGCIFRKFRNYSDLRNSFSRNW